MDSTVGSDREEPGKVIHSLCARSFALTMKLTYDFAIEPKVRGTAPMRILLVEDDEILTDVLLKALSSQHYIVDATGDGESGWEYAQSTSYDLILLDIGLPKLDGVALCQRLRSQKYTTPILLITARDASCDRIRGLDAGADDYLVKPLDLAELQARIRALSRRGEVAPTAMLQVGNLRLDPGRCQVNYGEKLLNLTPKEYSLLEVFLRHPTRVFSRGQLVEHLWTFDDPPLEESVKAHIKGLRQKLKAVGSGDLIENVYGLGYRLKQGVEAQAEQANASDMVDRFNQGREQLWQQYAGLMAERLEILEQAALAVEQEPLSDALQQSARQAAHKLAGVLGIFDRDAGTALARQIEQILLESPLSSEPLHLRELITQLAAVLNLTQPDRASPPGTPHPVAITSEAMTASAIVSPPASPASAVHVLAVDDDPAFLAALHPMLEPWGVHLTTLENPLRFWDILPKVAPDLLILDVEMPQVTGIELCQAVRADSHWQSLPILFLTARHDLDTIQQIFTIGADDYITKPIVGAELLSRITNRLDRLRLLQTLATQDPLTGLANQPHSSRELERLLTANPLHLFCLAIFTVIALHQLNFQYGHATTNQVLQRWGRLFQMTLGSTATLSYWGNGEFLVGLSGCGKSKAEECLADMQKTLRQQVFTAPDQSRFQVGFSFGLAVNSVDGTTLQSLYQTARCHEVTLN